VVEHQGLPRRFAIDLLTKAVAFANTLDQGCTGHARFVDDEDARVVGRFFHRASGVLSAPATDR